MKRLMTRPMVAVMLLLLNALAISGVVQPQCMVNKVAVAAGGGCDRVQAATVKGSAGLDDTISNHLFEDEHR